MNPTDRLIEAHAVIGSLRAALRACVYKRRKDRPNADPKWVDGEHMDEDPWGYIRRCDATARKALEL